MSSHVEWTRNLRSHNLTLIMTVNHCRFPKCLSSSEFGCHPNVINDDEVRPMTIPAPCMQSLEDARHGPLMRDGTQEFAGRRYWYPRPDNNDRDAQGGPQLLESDALGLEPKGASRAQNASHRRTRRAGTLVRT